ncbi:MAG: hypothetical protein KDK66_05485 [Deltaproteobacteria bacterium]|nr:hypothetical protein [Deltaproteobacteria bacterium]
MKPATNYLEEVGELITGLEKIGFLPILVGGMALSLLGSRRVTRDFDFVIPKPKEDMEDLVNFFYKQGFELASKLDKNGDVIRTIDNAKVATSRLKMDAPESAYFYKASIGLRVDLLFDFPIQASRLAKKASKKKISSYVFYIAAKEDLIRLKKIASTNRSHPGDNQDLEFLKKLK